MKKWNMIIDVANCTNCNVCALSVQDEHVGNAFEGYAEEMPKHGHRWINIERRERGSAPATDVAYLPTMCQHCDDAPCQKAAPDAVQKRADGIVIIDPVKAKGRREIQEACPFGAVWWNEEKDIPQHWIFDAHLLDKGWARPRCETACATAAIRSVKVTDDEMAAMAEAEGLERRTQSHDIKTRLYYKNLWRFDSDFIAGTLSAEGNGVTDCVAGALITLSQDGAVCAQVTSDAYGDFKFDRLTKHDAAYEIAISATGYQEQSSEVRLSGSRYLGEIKLQTKSRAT